MPVRSSLTAVFDLSVMEKLQLLEDRWDDRRFINLQDKMNSSEAFRALVFYQRVLRVLGIV
jgi:hypothetical protein